jgi:hypothetical protein
MVDVPTNPAARLGLRARSTALVSYLKSRLAEVSIRCDRYTLVRPPGIVRHSTTDILDARNGLSLRFGAPCVLLEGRRSSRRDVPAGLPTHVALARTLDAILTWANGHSTAIATHQGGFESIPVRCSYHGDGRPLRLAMRSTTASGIRVVRIPGRYVPRVRTTVRIEPPAIYAVPRSLTKVLRVLERHGFQTIGVHDRRRSATEASTINTNDFVLFPTDQPGGHALTVLLEPRSMFGLHRFGRLGLAIEPGGRYPIVRLEPRHRS